MTILLVLAGLLVLFYAYYRRYLTRTVFRIDRHPGLSARDLFPFWLTKSNPLKSGRLSYWAVVKGGAATIILSRLVLAARRLRKDPAFAERIGESLMRIWGEYLLGIAQATLTVTGLHHLKGLTGRCIVASTHQSYLDFAVLPHVLISHSLHLRFLAARDHFLENIWLYRVMGIGRAMEAMGMIFVDRRETGGDRRERGKELINGIAAQMAATAVDAVIFPQGTRARPHHGPNGARLDSGYYTAGQKERLTEPRGHLKKGCAHLARAVAEKERVHIIPIGLCGLGTIVPKYRIGVQLGEEVTVAIGEPITLEPHPAQPLPSVEEIMATLDQRLRRLIQIDPRLQARFFKDAQLTPTPARLARITAAGPLFYATLDSLYALPAPQQAPYISMIKSWLVSMDPTDRLIAIRLTILGHN